MCGIVDCGVASGWMCGQVDKVMWRSSIAVAGLIMKKKGDSLVAG